MFVYTFTFQTEKYFVKMTMAEKINIFAFSQKP